MPEVRFGSPPLSESFGKIPHPPPELPFELHEEVIKCLSSSDQWPDTDPIANCALTCKAWHEVAVKCLYNPIEIFGKRKYPSLKETLKSNESLASHVHMLSVHDVINTERISHIVLHHLPRCRPNLKHLIIFGMQHPEKNTFPMHSSLLMTLRHCHSIRHLSLHQFEVDSLTGLRKVLGALSHLETAVFQNVSWVKVETPPYRPIFNGTSWRLRGFSLSNCPSGFVAPLFWASPAPSSSRLDQRQRRDDDGRHPSLLFDDVAPVIDLAKLVRA